MDGIDSEETIAANLHLRKVLKSALFTETKTAVALQEAIDALVDNKLADFMNALSDRIENKTGVRP
jgi:hypothetical protein